jgi:CheY-like chemotaxis protein
VRRAGGQAQIAVADTGIGIAPDQLARIFEPFVQIGRADGAQPGGMGLGLSLAKSLVELHGGRIRAESEGARRGSRFVVDLPRAVAPAAAEAPGERATAAPRRWLVVDDNSDVTESQATLLRLLGHEVETANNGAEALRKAKAFRPEIILLDLGMPGMDGFEVARRLRAMPEGRATLLVAQTGWAQAEDRRRTLEAGFDAHFAKPVDVASLLRLVAT